MRWIFLFFLILMVGCAPAKKNEHPAGHVHHEGMVMEEPAQKTGEVMITKEEEKLAGVEIGRVERRLLHKEIRTTGTIAHDPTLYVAQEEYIGAVGLGDETLVEAGKKRLKVLGLNDAQIARLEKAGKAEEHLILPADKTWVYITVYENETGLVKVGTLVDIETVAFPGEVFPGKIAAVSPALDPMTRSARARAEIQNPGQKLKPAMYADVKIKINLGSRLAVNEEAVINTGKRTMVMVSKGNGNYSGRDIKLGQRAEGYYEVLGGLKEGERVVTTGNFLLDSESRLKSGGGTEHQH